MSDFLPTRDQIETASALVHRTLPPTAHICWPQLCRRVGAEVWVKHENHQPVGSFKIRGSLVLINDWSPSLAPSTDIISATRGNHGQGLAFATRQFGLKTTIVVPRKNSREKNAAMQALGAELIEHGNDFADAYEHAQHLAKERAAPFAPSFHPLLIRGVASYWLEFFTALPDLDTVYVPIGLGSGICAGIATRDALGLRTAIVGVVASSAPTYARSYAQGAPVSHPVAPTLADGVAVPHPDPAALELIARGVERVLEIDEASIKEAMRTYFIDTHNVAEGAAAIPLAALLQERDQQQGKKIGLILTGSNVDHEIFADALTLNPLS